MLLGEHSSSSHQDGALGFVPADYGVTINVPLSDPRYGKYPDIAKKKATYYRQETAKRQILEGRNWLYNGGRKRGRTGEGRAEGRGLESGRAW